MIGSWGKKGGDNSNALSKNMVNGSIEGILKRKNRHHEFKERYCMFKDNEFITFKPSKGLPTTEVKEQFPLREIDGVSFDEKGRLLVRLLNGEVSIYKGDNLKVWHEQFETRIAAATESFQRNISTEVSNGSGTIIAGYLMKKSHNKYQGFQERYVKLEGLILKYYKKEGETNELGAVNIHTAEFIRPYDDAPDCRIFEVKDNEDRVFSFQTSNYKEMMHWVSTLNTVRTAAQGKAQIDEAARLEAETPARIRFYDNEGEDMFKQTITESLLEMYPDPADINMTVKMHLNYAKDIVAYLQNLIPEMQKCGTRPARYDILAVIMTQVNVVLADRFHTFLPSSPVLDNATLGDLHMLIDWISKYQLTLKSIRCPVATATNLGTTQAKLSTTHLTPKYCEIFELTHHICELYVYGGSPGSKGGAAAHLVDHCLKVWQSVENNPEEMIQHHTNGTFYTHSPIDMWEAINSHISLATSTNSPILHVMIAEKVVDSLTQVFTSIIKYIQTLDTSTRPSLREIELEYISALANDTALHIEEVIELIESFTIAEIRDKIDNIFDPLTTNLVACGQACLKRLASLVMQDVQGLLDEVFEEEWMEGNQMHVATATISDYMKDFERYLVPFWADKFVITILEEVILSYTRTLLFRKTKRKNVERSVTTPATPQQPAAQEGSKATASSMFSSFFKKTTQSIIQQTQTIIVTTSVPTHVPVDEESLGRLAQDVNILNAFFFQKAGQDVATDILQLINEVSLMLFVDFTGLISHVTLRMKEYPSAALPIYEVAIAVMKLRNDDFNKQQIDAFTTQIKGILEAAPPEATKREQEGVAEGRLGLLYMDVVPADILQAPAKNMTLAQRMKVMANIPLFGGSGSAGNKKKRGSSTNNADDDDDDDDIDDDEDDPDANTADSPDGRRRTSTGASNTNTSNKLIVDVMEVLQQQDTIDHDLVFAHQQAMEEEEAARLKAGVISYDGYLEKKSPAHNLWQRRYFKFSTRVTTDANRPFVYTLMWYKKEGDSVIKALDVEKIDYIAMIATPRAMAYLPPPKQQLLLMSEASTAGGCINPIAVQEMEHEENTPNAMSLSKALRVTEEYFTFIVAQTDGKEHILRGGKVDRVMKWINVLTSTTGLAYDSKERCWTRSAMDHYKQLEQERKLIPSFENVAASPLPNVALGKGNRSYSTEFGNNSGEGSSSPNSSSPVYNAASAAAMIKTAKRLSSKVDVMDFKDLQEQIGMKEVAEEEGRSDGTAAETTSIDDVKKEGDKAEATTAAPGSPPRHSPLQRLSKKISGVLSSSTEGRGEEAEMVVEKEVAKKDPLRTDNPLQRKAVEASAATKTTEESIDQPPVAVTAAAKSTHRPIRRRAPPPSAARQRPAEGQPQAEQGEEEK